MKMFCTRKLMGCHQKEKPVQFRKKMGGERRK
jgi:hypothetical protein